MAKIYQKIRGIGTGRGSFQIASRSRVYTARDHLLVMQSTGYTEEYKRIFFRDVRSVEVRHTNGQFWNGLISAIITLLLSLTYFVYVPRGLVAVFCFPFAVWFLANLLRGPTCECYINTNVQTLKLPAPRRVKKVAMLIEFLRAQTAAFDSADAPQPVA
jgi:hypothetical protein